MQWISEATMPPDQNIVVHTIIIVPMIYLVNPSLLLILLASFDQALHRLFSLVVQDPLLLLLMSGPSY